MMTTPAHETLIDYYSRRAAEYEAIYDKPERQADLAALKAYVQTVLGGQEVLEVACGTGYWTNVLAETCKSICAVDASLAMLELALQKPFPANRVQFQQADAYSLDKVDGSFTAGYAAFWWSHIAKRELPAFLQGFHAALEPGATVCFIDNLYVEGSSTPLAHTDAEGNTYQERHLHDDSRHRVLKNFPTEADVRETLRNVAKNIVWRDFYYYWCCTYTVV